MSEKKTTSRRLTEADKTRIEELFALGERTQEELAEEFGVSLSTIGRHLKKAGVEKGERSDEIRDAVRQQVSEEVSEHAARVVAVKEDSFKRVDAINKLIFHEIADAAKSRTAVSEKIANLKALKLAQEALKMGRDEMYTILGINPDDTAEDMPDLIFKIVEDGDIRDAVERQISVFDQTPDNDAIEDIDDIVVLGEED